MSDDVSLGQAGWRFARIAAQVASLCAIWWIADTASRRMAMEVPGGVLGLLAVLALLHAGWLPLRMISSGAQWLLAEMLLFFVPAATAIARHGELLCRQGICVVGVIVLSTTLVIVATALAVDWAWRAERYLMHLLAARHSVKGAETP